MSLLQLAERLEATAFSTWVRESSYGFAILVAVHLLSLTVSVGTLIWFDLRLLGFSMPAVPVSRMYRRLMPLTLVGFVLMFASGAMLLAGYATAAYGNLYFRIKLLALVIAGVNAFFYHRVTERQIAAWDQGRVPSPAARAAGLISIAVWTVVILAGRMMSYTMF
jgi:hypothetical protein